MTLQTQQPTTEHSPVLLTDEQRRRVADALESAQSENTRKNYASQFGQFRTWCEQEGYSSLPAQPEVLAAYAVELADDGKSMSTIRLAVASIVDAHRRAGLDSPVSPGVSETLRGLTRQLGVSQKQARPLDADALAAIRATALNPRITRGGSLESEETALLRGRLDTALASVMSDAGLRISEAAALRWRDLTDAEDGAGLVYIERSKTDQVGEGAYVVVTPDALAALKLFRQDSEAWTDDDLVFGLSMSQISRRVDRMARAAGLGGGIFGPLRSCGPGLKDDTPWRSSTGGTNSWVLKVTDDSAAEVHSEREGAGGA